MIVEADRQFAQDTPWIRSDHKISARTRFRDRHWADPNGDEAQATAAHAASIRAAATDAIHACDLARDVLMVHTLTTIERIDA